MIALIIGTLLAIGAMAWVLAPLFRSDAGVPSGPVSSARSDISAAARRLTSFS